MCSSDLFPFLTAANDPADTAEMLHEMATSGSAMAVLVTLAWLGVVAVTSRIEASKNDEKKKAGATV